MADIYVELSEAARKAAIAATGKDPGETVKVAFADSDRLEDRALVAGNLSMDERLTAGGAWRVIRQDRQRLRLETPCVSCFSIAEALMAFAKAAEAKRIARKAELLAQCEKWLHADGWFPHASYDEQLDLGDIWKQAQAKLDAAHDADRARQAAQSKAWVEAEAAKKDAIDAEWENWTGIWLRMLGTLDQKQRHGRDLLPEKEILDGIKFLLLEIEDEPLYQPLEPQDVTHTDSCAWASDGEVGFKTEAMDEATAAEFAALRKIELAFEITPEAEREHFETQIDIPRPKIGLRKHIATCSTCEATAERASVRCSVVVGGHRLAMDYAVPE